MPEAPATSARIPVGVLLLVIGCVVLAFTLPIAAWLGFMMLAILPPAGLALIAAGLIEIIRGLRARS